MRLALVHMRHARAGGTERFLNALARELVSRGHATTIVCRSHDAPPHPEVRFRVLRGPALGSAGRMLAFARAAERHVRSTPYDLVVGLGKTWSQDVLRLGGGCHATYLEKAHRFTLTSWERALRTDRRKHRLALAIEARALAPGAYRAVVVNSEMVERDVRARYAVPPERLVRIPNGVDLARFRPVEDARRAELRRALELEEGAFLVGFLGTGFGRKGLDRLLGAWPAVVARHPQALLAVAGRDAAPARFEALARRAGVAERVRFLGPSEHPERFLAACDLSVLPTRYDTFALTILEALACGVPVVTTADAGGSEVLDEGVHGGVVEGRASDAELAEALLPWCDAERTRAARDACRARAERYPQERAAREMAALCEGLRGAG